MSGEKNMQEILYRNFIKSLGDEVLVVSAPEPPEPGQVRLYLMTPPEYVLITEKVHEDLYEVVPLTSYIPLAITDRYPPVIEWRGLRLVPLPFVVYIARSLLERHSEPVFRVKGGLEKVSEYASTARIRGVGKWREKFIKKNIQRWKDINLSSIIADVLSAEAQEEAPVVIEFPSALFEERNLPLAAQPATAFRGENWLGVLEEGKLYLYLPEECEGKNIRISYRGNVLYEGPASPVVVLKNVPERLTDLEEELNVQVLGD